MSKLTPEIIQARFSKAQSRRSQWESHWQDCYDYALPRRDGTLSSQTVGESKQQNLFDGTAPDAVEQLASSLMAELTPAWSSWFRLIPGAEVAEENKTNLEDGLSRLSQTVQGHFDRSNFIVELHQCYLDLVTAGTACLLFEEAPFGEPSAFKFTAIPLGEVVMEEGPTGRLDSTYRKSSMSEASLKSRFPKATLPESMAVEGDDENDKRYNLIEAVCPNESGRYDYMAILIDEEGQDGQPMVLSEGQYESSPFITFRWIKAPGEIYGRSPVMKALPDIKTANKIVELMLKNASIAVTGIWQADDDGVLNPATIKLAPGTIIPKAVGSRGLQPLVPAGDMTLSEGLLEKIRAQISMALYRDQLGQPQSPGMSATEFVERTESMTRNLSAIFGRLHGELILPLAERALAILRRKGDIDQVIIDGREINLQINSPLAMRQRLQKAKPILRWIEMVKQASPQGAGLLNETRVAEYLAELLGLPEGFVNSPETQQPTTAQQPANPLAAMQNNNTETAGTDINSIMKNMENIDPETLLNSLPDGMRPIAEKMAQDMESGNLDISQVQSQLAKFGGAIPPTSTQ